MAGLAFGIVGVAQGVLGAKIGFVVAVVLALVSIFEFRDIRRRKQWPWR